MSKRKKQKKFNSTMAIVSKQKANNKKENGVFSHGLKTDGFPRRKFYELETKKVQAITKHTSEIIIAQVAVRLENAGFPLEKQHEIFGISEDEFLNLLERVFDEYDASLITTDVVMARKKKKEGEAGEFISY